MTEPWCEELERISASVDRAEEALRELYDWASRGVGKDVWPRELEASVAAPLKRLTTEIEQIRQAERAAFDRYAAMPASKWYRGHSLTHEEYHLFVAHTGPFATAKSLGLFELDDYDVFRLMCYEDEDSYCYINPFEQARDHTPGKVGRRIGRPPEELNVTALRPEQHEFFARYLPEVYARFRA
jgi:hypothetical protein